MAHPDEGAPVVVVFARCQGVRVADGTAAACDEFAVMLSTAAWAPGYLLCLSCAAACAVFLEGELRATRAVLAR